LLFGREPDLGKLAQRFKDRGKPVWYDWTEIPPTEEWPQGGYLAAKRDMSGSTMRRVNRHSAKAKRARLPHDSGSIFRLAPVYSASKIRR